MPEPRTAGQLAFLSGPVNAYRAAACTPINLASHRRHTVRRVTEASIRGPLSPSGVSMDDLASRVPSESAWSISRRTLFQTGAAVVACRAGPHANAQTARAP